MDNLTGFEFDWTRDPKELREAYKSTHFDEHFYNLTAKEVIAVLSPQLVQDPHNLIYDDELVYNRLIGPLERFICNMSGDAPQEEVDQILAYLKSLKQPTKMCHKVLKTGDVLFSCNDCGFDATCVVCIDCFHKSAHKDHNYRMSNTDGGGCCDCGDVEAWKQFPSCSDHAAPDQPSLKLSDFEDAQKRSKQLESDKLGILEKISLLPRGLASRYFLVCQACLHYARMMLTWNDFNSLPQYLDISSQLAAEDKDDDKSIRRLLDKAPGSKNYFTVLFNDEIHTYDHVISTLVKIIKCSKMTASIMASSVSREGRSLVHQDQYKPCKQIRDAISCIRDSGQAPLTVEVIHGSVLAHQAFALKLIEWIHKMATICDAFRVLTAYTLLGTYDTIPNHEDPDPQTDMTLLERVMRSNTSFWKMARIDWNDLFVTAMLTEYSMKDRFARLLTRIYPRLIQDFVDDDHDHAVSVLTMTTQLYTVPSLVCMLIEEEDALSIISQTFNDVCRSTKRESSSINFENRHTWDMQGLKRGFYIISDLRHLINIEPTKWTDKLRENVIKAVKIFLNLLGLMQGMDSVRRQVGQHIEYEPEWETGMTLQSRLVNLISRWVKYCSFDEKVLTETLRETQLRLLKDGGYKTITKELFGHSANCIQYDVSSLPVSVHLPLTRFAAALIVELMQRRPCVSLPYDESLVILTSASDKKKQREDRLDPNDDDDDEEEEEKQSGSKVASQSRASNSMIDIMEPSLRTEVMIAQFRSGMWRRNGYSLVNQIIYFSGALMRREMFDRDILLLQECAATCEANKYMIHILNKFNLINWVKLDTNKDSSPAHQPKPVNFSNDEDIMTQTMSLGEEFLQILLTIIGERYRVGVGKIQEEDVIKNEIIQLLCIGPYTRSEIAQKLYANDNEIDCIKCVANLKRSSESSTGKYELKEEFYPRFNPFFYHYTRRHQSHALDSQLKRKRNAKDSLVCCPPPEPVELADQFKNINQLLICDLTLLIIQRILRRAISPYIAPADCSTSPVKYLASDLQLDQCLHLIGLGLHEQTRDPFQFDYIKAAHGNLITELLNQCYMAAKRSKDLVFWLMKKMIDIIDKMERQANDQRTIDEEHKEVYSSVRLLFSPVLSACDTVKHESMRKSSELAAQRRERIMAMMKAKQNSFLSNPATKQLAAETAKHEAPAQSLRNPRQPMASPSTRSSSSFVALREIAAGTSSGTASSSAAAASASGPSSMDYELTSNMVEPQQHMGSSASTDNSDVLMDADVASLGQTGQDSDSNIFPMTSSSVGASHLCILCRDEQVVNFDKPTMVLLAYIQRSAVLSKNRKERRIPNYALTPTNQLKHLPLSLPVIKPIGMVPEKYSFTSDNSWSFDASYMPADLFFGPYISTCGHVMHYDCWKGFTDSITKRETSRPNRGSRHVSFELEKNEILCPLCECISNATIPLIADYTNFIGRNHCWPDLESSTSDEQRKDLIEESAKPTSIFSPCFGIENSAECLTKFLHALKGSISAYSHIRQLNTTQQPGPLPTAMVPTNNIHGDKYLRLLQPIPFNDVLKDLEEDEALRLRDFVTCVRNERLSSSYCSNTLLISIQTLADRIHAVGLDFDKSINCVHHARVFMMTSWTISYTIQAQERAARFKGTPIFDDLESSKNLCLSSIVRFANASMLVHHSDMIQSFLVQKLRYLLVSEQHLMSSPSCLDIDAFELFVSIFMMLQKFYSHIPDQTSQGTSPDKTRAGEYVEQPEQQQQQNEEVAIDMSISDRTAGNQGVGSSQHNTYLWTTRSFDHEYYRNLLHLMLIMNFVQVSITILNDIATEERRQQDHSAPKEREEEESNELTVLRNFFKDIVLASGHPCRNLSKMDDHFVSKLKQALLPFLRSCAIFFYQLSHLKPNDTLTRISAFHEGADFATGNEEQRSSREEKIDYRKSNDEFDAICQYLSLPADFNNLLRSQEARNLALSWLRHSRVLLLIKSAIEAKQQAESETTKHSSGLKRTNSAVSTCGQLGRTTSSSSAVMATTSMSEQTSSNDSELMPVRLIRQPHSVNRLIDLPYDYSELVDKVSSFTCPSIKNEDSRTPTMCLVCGIMLCSQSYCCQRDLNDLASNYKQVVKRQEENRLQWIAANASSSSSGGTLGESQRDVGGANQANSMAAWSALFSNAISGGPAVQDRNHWEAVAAAAGGLGHQTAALRSTDESIRSAALNSFTSMIYSSNINQQLVGSCTYHAHECSGGVGVFLRIRNCQILLLSGRSKGCYMPAPYIDDHGETDFGLMRGNPLHLNRQLYERLQTTWMNHTIPEQISRTLEYSPYASNINWHLH